MIRRALGAVLLSLPAGIAVGFGPPEIALFNDAKNVALVIPSSDHADVIVLSTAEGTPVGEPLPVYLRHVEHIAFGPPTKRKDEDEDEPLDKGPGIAVMALADGRLEVVDLKTGRARELATRVPKVTDLQLARSWSLLAAVTRDKVMLLDTAVGGVTTEYPLDGQGCGAVAVNDEFFLIGTGKGTVRCHIPAMGSLVRELTPPKSAAVTAMDMESPELVVVGYGDGTVRVWNPVRGIELAQWRLEAGAVPTAVAFWPAAKWVAVASAKRPVELHDSVGGVSAGAFPAETAGAVALDGGVGATIATLYPDGRVLILDARARSIKSRYQAKLPAGATVPGRP